MKGEFGQNEDSEGKVSTTRHFEGSIGERVIRVRASVETPLESDPFIRNKTKQNELVEVVVFVSSLSLLLLVALPCQVGYSLES